MKKLILIFCFVFSNLFLAQTAEREHIEQEAYNFMLYLEKKEYDKILDFSHPKIFEYASREEMKALIKMTFEGDEELRVELPSVKREDFQASEFFKTEEGGVYALIVYPLSMKLKFLKQTFDEESKKVAIGLFDLRDMKAEFIDESTVKVDKTSLTIALKDTSTHGEWKYINHDENNPLYLKILSKSIIKHAKDYLFSVKLR